MFNCIFCIQLFIKDIHWFFICHIANNPGLWYLIIRGKGWLDIYSFYNFLVQIAGKHMEITGSIFPLYILTPWCCCPVHFYLFYQKCSPMNIFVFIKFPKLLWVIACVFCYYSKVFIGSILTDYLWYKCCDLNVYSFGHNFVDFFCIKSFSLPVHQGGYEESQGRQDCGGWSRSGGWECVENNEGKFGTPAGMRRKGTQPQPRLSPSSVLGIFCYNQEDE